MYLDIKRQHMKTTKLKMHPGKAAKKVLMQRLYGQMATERKKPAVECSSRFSWAALSGIG